MAKAFLSHSSTQKDFVLKYPLLNGKTIIDSKDFETGMQNMEEIDELIQNHNYLLRSYQMKRWIQNGYNMN